MLECYLCFTLAFRLFFCFSLFFVLRRMGNVKLELTTLPRFFVRVVCRLNSASVVFQRYRSWRALRFSMTFVSLCVVHGIVHRIAFSFFSRSVCVWGIVLLR